MKYHKLDAEGNVVECSLEEALGQELHDNVIKQDTVGDKFISTVFLPFNGLFETMVFQIDSPIAESVMSEYTRRCTSKAIALANHTDITKLVTEEGK